MKRRMLLVVFALAMLPALSAGAGETQVIKTRDLEQLVGELADWSRPHAGPGEYLLIHKVSFCQKRARGVPKSQPQYCRPMLYAMGNRSQPGYMQADAAPESDVPSGSGDWYQVSSEWNKRLWSQFRHQITWMDEYLIFRSADVDKQMEEVADWSRKIDPPVSHRKSQRILFCQLLKDDTDASPAGTESCYVVLLKRGGMWTPGYVRFADANGAENKNTSAPWFRLAPEWDKSLKDRIRNAEVARSMTSLESTSTTTTYAAPYRGCWYGEIVYDCSGN
jgi:hypothetical protein